MEVVYLVALVLAALVPISVPSPICGNIVVKKSDATMQATYLSCTHSDAGIKLSAVENVFEMTSLQDEQLVSSKLLNRHGDRIMSILDANVLNFRGENYLLPDYLRTAIEEGQEDLSFVVEQLSLFQSESQSVLQSRMQQFVKTREAEVIKEMMQVLHDQGEINGKTHPELLPFLVFAMRLQNANQAELKAASRGQDSPDRLTLTCNSLEDNKHNDCLGMCGFECVCWSIICGNCCYHHGCYEHDICCRKKYFSPECLFPVDLRCNGYSPDC